MWNTIIGEEKNYFHIHIHMHSFVLVMELYRKHFCVDESTLINGLVFKTTFREISRCMNQFQFLVKQKSKNFLNPTHSFLKRKRNGIREKPSQDRMAICITQAAANTAMRLKAIEALQYFVCLFYFITGSQKIILYNIIQVFTKPSTVISDVQYCRVLGLYLRPPK